MNYHSFTLSAQTLWAMPNGALFWPDDACLIVSDLHLGKSERMARRAGMLLPPYETADTLQRLQDCIDVLAPRKVICLGDSFDDTAAAHALSEAETLWLTKLQAGREWIWVAGNHDPEPIDFGGSQIAEYQSKGLVFRHIAQPGATGEISGHYHPKASINAKGRRITRACFLVDGAKVVMPAFGTYTGGLQCTDPALAGLLGAAALAILTGPQAVAMPMPR